jgi:hypothetical protein
MIFGINVISDRHYIMTGRLVIIITQHKIKIRRPPITIDKRYIMAEHYGVFLEQKITPDIVCCLAAIEMQ